MLLIVKFLIDCDLDTQFLMHCDLDTQFLIDCDLDTQFLMHCDLDTAVSECLCSTNMKIFIETSGAFLDKKN